MNRNDVETAMFSFVGRLLALVLTPVGLAVALVFKLMERGQPHVEDIDREHLFPTCEECEVAIPRSFEPCELCGGLFCIACVVGHDCVRLGDRD